MSSGNPLGQAHATRQVPAAALPAAHDPGFSQQSLGWRDGNSAGAADTKEAMGEPRDAVLWERAVAGDSGSFGELFERHSRSVYNYCFRRTGDWSQAEDLIAVVFLEAWRRRSEIRLEREDALPWLLGVATNVIRNARRSQRRQRAALARRSPATDESDLHLRLRPESARGAVSAVGSPIVLRVCRRPRWVLARAARPFAHDDLCLDLAAHGVAAWNVEYRRVGVGGGWPETFLDVAAAVDLLATLAAPLDLGRVSTVGHSAGGHLAFWAAARPTLPHGAPGADPAVRIGGAVSQAGVLDLALAAQIRPSAEPTRALLGPPEADPSRYELSSPRARVPLGIPQLLLHGDRDETVSIRIATSYAAAARDAGDPCELRVLSGVGHFEHIDARSYVWHMARDWLVAQASAERS